MDIENATITVSEELFECKFCDGIFNKKSTLKRHRRFCTNRERPEICNICQKTFINKKGLDYHVKKMHTGNVRKKIPKVFTCEVCGKKVTTKYTLKVHSYQHANEKPYVCEYCGKGFINKRHCFVHMQIHKGIKHNVCRYCDKSFITEGNLRTHILFHTREKNFACEVCDKRFFNSAHCQQHYYFHHATEARYTCSVCGKKFHTPAPFKKHCLIHSKEKNFVCEVCGEGFIFAKQLKRHQYHHTGDWPCRCNICDKGFLSPTYLKKHEEAVHLGMGYGKRQLRCKFCRQRFFKRPELDAHIANHERDNQPDKECPVVRQTCELCLKTFELPHELRKHHLAEHPQNFPYVCNRCQEAFAESSQLRYHIDLLHRREDTLIYKCDKCEEAFDLILRLNDHYYVHLEGQPLECDVCGAKYALEKALFHHKVKTHSSFKEKVEFTCVSCPRKFATKFSFYAHLKTHKDIQQVYELQMDDTEASGTEEGAWTAVEIFDAAKAAKAKNDIVCKKRQTMRYRCGICFEEFERENDMDEHCKIHHTHCCDVCDHAFFTEKDLEQHYLTHIEEHYQLFQVVDSHACSACKLYFPTASELEKHKFSDVCGKHLDSESEFVPKNFEPAESSNSSVEVDMTRLGFDESSTDGDAVDTRALDSQRVTDDDIVQTTSADIISNPENSDHVYIQHVDSDSEFDHDNCENTDFTSSSAEVKLPSFDDSNSCVDTDQMQDVTDNVDNVQTESSVNSQRSENDHTAPMEGNYSIDIITNPENICAANETNSEPSDSKLCYILQQVKKLKMKISSLNDKTVNSGESNELNKNVVVFIENERATIMTDSTTVVSVEGTNIFIDEKSLPQIQVEFE